MKSLAASHASEIAELVERLLYTLYEPAGAGQQVTVHLGQTRHLVRAQLTGVEPAPPLAAFAYSVKK